MKGIPAMRVRTRIPRASILALVLHLIPVAAAFAADRVLIFTKTAGYREDNIAPTRAALKIFFETKGLSADTSENAALFADSSLAKYKAIVFLKTSGDVLNPSQQTAFEKWFRAGGGWVGIHSALGTENDWPFYGKFLGGGWYKNLAGDITTKHTLVIEDTAHLSTRALPVRWERTDEVYNTIANPRSAIDPKVHVLVTVDESTYKGGVPGADHPMSWCVEYQGGRAWVTATGHTTASYSDPLFLSHVWGGMAYALGRTSTAMAFPQAGEASMPGAHGPWDRKRLYTPAGRRAVPGDRLIIAR
jgi:type 1 glutamine amidotransferase